MNIGVSTKIQTRIVDAKTKQIVKQSPWHHNLVNDQGLNALARQANSLGATNPAGCFSVCRIGSGNTANKISSGAITFTQSGTTLTASGGFFTSAMVNGLFKWGTGTGGNEIYITAFTNSTTVTVGTSATVSTPDVGTVWQVQETGLVTPLFVSNTYQTLTGDCGTTYNTGAGTITYKRTFVFAQQASPYNVNEIGWSPSSAGNVVGGRIVLPSTDVVGTTNFYVVVISMTFAFSPATPTAQVNVGTNIDTTGTFMLEQFSLQIVTTTGTISNPANGMGVAFDPAGTVGFEIWTNDWTQNANTTDDGSGPTLPAGRITCNGGIPQSWVYNSSRGACRLTQTFSTTTTGQTAYGIGAHCQVSPFDIAFDVHFTTPVTLPTGTFSGSMTFQLLFNRVLNNT